MSLLPRDVLRACLLVLASASCARVGEPARTVVDTTKVGDTIVMRLSGDVDGEIRQESAVDGRTLRRLCGYLVSRPIADLRVPVPGTVDSTAPRAALHYVEGRGLIGMRYLVGGASPAYVLMGLADDGTRVVTAVLRAQWYRHSAPDSLVASRMLARYDSVSLDVLGPGTLRGRRSADLPAPDLEADVAVPDIRAMPTVPLSLTRACPVATIGTLSHTRIERLYHVEVQAGDTLLVRATPSAGRVAIALDTPAVIHPQQASGRFVEDTFVVNETRRAVIRLLYAARVRQDPLEAFTMLSVARRSGR
ncbi:MAG: hypothetical protein MUF00_15500 [Gemmatimonadaceae bacterium]|jgi:hypothetical protein|nr:hypothetical protein [Gemmatimonadaceae bacterium]